MNNKGQSLITFILLLPIIILVLAFLVDSSLMMLEKNKIDGVIKSNMKAALKSDIRDSNQIKDSIKKTANIDISVQINDDELKVNAISSKKSLFSKILNFSWHNLDFNYCGNYQTLKINKKCG